MSMVSPGVSERGGFRTEPLLGCQFEMRARSHEVTVACHLWGSVFQASVWSASKVSSPTSSGRASRSTCESWIGVESSCAPWRISVGVVRSAAGSLRRGDPARPAQEGAGSDHRVAGDHRAPDHRAPRPLRRRESEPRRLTETAVQRRRHLRARRRCKSSAPQPGAVQDDLHRRGQRRARRLPQPVRRAEHPRPPCRRTELGRGGKEDGPGANRDQGWPLGRKFTPDPFGVSNGA